MPQFQRYVGIDYSGAETPDSSRKGLRVYVAEGTRTPEQIQPPPSPRRYWTRRGLADWLREELDRDIPTIVGIDHAFSFPLAYFEKYRLSSDWPTFLVDFRRNWPTDDPGNFIDLIRDGGAGNGLNRMGDSSWLRLTEQWTATAKSVFLFDVQGTVAKSTHAGLPWLLYLRKQCRRPLHFWPFDGWEILQGKSAIVEVYPSLWSHCGRNDSQRTAETGTSKLPTLSRLGSNEPTRAAPLQTFSTRR